MYKILAHNIGYWPERWLKNRYRIGTKITISVDPYIEDGQSLKSCKSDIFPLKLVKNKVITQNYSVFLLHTCVSDNTWSLVAIFLHSCYVFTIQPLCESKCDDKTRNGPQAVKDWELEIGQSYKSFLFIYSFYTISSSPVCNMTTIKWDIPVAKEATNSVFTWGQDTIMFTVLFKGHCKKK